MTTVSTADPHWQAIVVMQKRSFKRRYLQRLDYSIGPSFGSFQNPSAYPQGDTAVRYLPVSHAFPSCSNEWHFPFSSATACVAGYVGIYVLGSSNHLLPLPLPFLLYITASLKPASISNYPSLPITTSHPDELSNPHHEQNGHHNNRRWPLRSFHCFIPPACEPFAQNHHPRAFLPLSLLFFPQVPHLYHHHHHQIPLLPRNRRRNQCPPKHLALPLPPFCRPRMGPRPVKTKVCEK